MALLETTFTLSNIAIAAGYLYAATAVMPQMKVDRWQTKVGGFLFFLTCGFTHLELAIHSVVGDEHGVADFGSWHMVAIHLVQAAAVWLFLTSLYRELVEGTVSGPFQFRKRKAEHDDNPNV